MPVSLMADYVIVQYGSQVTYSTLVHLYRISIDILEIIILIRFTNLSSVHEYVFVGVATQ